MLEILQLYEEGPIRDLLFSLDIIQLLISIEIAILFFYRGWKDRMSWKVNFSWGVVFVCFGFFQLIAIYQIFYRTPGSPTSWMEVASFFVTFFSVIVLLEYFLQKYMKTRYSFTILFTIMGFIQIVSPESSSMTSFLAMLEIFVFGILFLWKLLKVSTGTVRKHFILFAIALVAKILGWFLVPTSEVTFFDPVVGGLVIRSVQIMGLILIAAVLVKLPIFFELDWREKLIQLFVVVRDKGIPVVHLKFQRAELPTSERVDVDGDLAAAGMMGITAMLKEISRSTEELKIIDHGDLKILLDHGTHFFIALIVQEKMNIYWDRLSRLHKTIETYFGDVLKSWDGNLKYFNPLELLVKHIFQ